MLLAPFRRGARLGFGVSTHEHGAAEPLDSAGADLLQREETTVTGQRKSVGAGLVLLLAAGLAACAPQQQQSRPAAISGQGTASGQSMQGHAGHTMSGGMQGHSMMAGMDHQSMMAHCDQMDRSMGSSRPR